MGLRQRDWARRVRAALIAELGGICRGCGTTEDLQLDCIVPQGDRHHKIEWSARISFYRSQHRAGNLQVLCESCHSEKSANELPGMDEVAAAPF